MNRDSRKSETNTKNSNVFFLFKNKQLLNQALKVHEISLGREMILP